LEEQWAMRVLIALSIGLLMLLVVDATVFDGRYREASWREAKEQGYHFSLQTRIWLKKIVP
jgi:hypothetical protein